MAQVLTKTEYAAYRGVTPAALSQWLSKGKIHGDAIVGQGRNARINVVIADRQLAATLDMGQQLARGGVVATDLPPAPAVQQPAADLFAAASDQPPATPAPSDGGPGGGTAKTSDSVARYNAARAASAEIDLADKLEKQLEKRGTYTMTADIKAVFARDLAQVIRTIEQWLPDVGAVIASILVQREADARAAGQSSVPMTARELSALLGREFRSVRMRMAEQASVRKGQEQTFIAVPLTLEEEGAPTE